MSFFNPNEALGMPKGSIRALLALLIIVPFIFVAFTSGIKLSGDQFIGIVTLVITAYFVKAAADTRGNG